MCDLYSPLQMSSPLRIDSSRHHTPVLADILQKHSINSLLDQPNILSDTNGKFRVMIYLNRILFYMGTYTCSQ